MVLKGAFQHAVAVIEPHVELHSDHPCIIVGDMHEDAITLSHVAEELHGHTFRGIDAAGLVVRQEDVFGKHLIEHRQQKGPPPHSDANLRLRGGLVAYRQNLLNQMDHANRIVNHPRFHIVWSCLSNQHFNALIVQTLALEQFLVFRVIANWIMFRHPENIAFRFRIGGHHGFEAKRINLVNHGIGRTDGSAMERIERQEGSDPAGITSHVGLHLIQTLHGDPNFDIPGFGVMGHALKQVLGPCINLVFVLNTLPLIRCQVLLPEFLKGFLPFEVIFHLPRSKITCGQHITTPPIPRIPQALFLASVGILQVRFGREQVPDQEMKLQLGHLVDRLGVIGIGPNGARLIAGRDPKSPLVEGRLRPDIQTIQQQRIAMVRNDVVADLKDDPLPLQPVVSPVQGPRLVIAADDQRRSSLHFDRLE